MARDDLSVSDPLITGSLPLLDGARELGPYKLIGILGEGGMGVVYLAEQTAPIRRRVAIKVLKLGMDTAQVVARFESERQALAVMDHPNIAKILDSGVTPRGRPYFVMEVAHGTPITEYADTHRLSTADRVRLFIDVCRAVQHAHHKGVIHRDLKPSNVLVTVGETGPLVKVIDFGIAKAVGIGLTDRTLVTQAGQMVGTPEYMSPEQAEMSGLDVDTRTDIYSLGVMLYELVVGALPFDLSAKPGYVISHLLREKETPRPSTRLTSMGDAVDAVARCRGTTPDSLRRELKSDLEWIILKAMEKDRTRRYETANGMAKDLERYLSFEPVVARPPSPAYRARKFVRRNRMAVAAAAIAGIAILGGAAAAAAGFVQARREQLRAERSATTAERVADFLVDIFHVSDPGVARGSTITAREILDRGAGRIRADLADQPAVQARMMRVIGDVYRQLGLYDDALELLAGAVAVAENAPDPREAGLAMALRRLGVVLRLRGDHAGAADAFERSLLAMAADGETGTVEHARVTIGLANVYLELGRRDDAEPLMREALAIQEQVLGAYHQDVSTTLMNLGIMYLQQRNIAAAEPYLRRSVEIDERNLGHDHPDLAYSLLNLGVAYQLEGRYDQAERVYRRAHSLWLTALGADHPNMASVLNNLGEAYWGQGKYEDAESSLVRAMELKTRTVGRDSPSMARSLKALANVYRDQGRHADAEALYLEALGIRDRHPDGLVAEMQELLEDYARLLDQTGRGADAAGLRRRAAETAAGAEG
jgi:eukaryotic-like serine/threonine-protein kinase